MHCKRTSSWKRWLLELATEQSVIVRQGFANQRLSVVSGVYLAHRLGRTAVLPNLLLSGSQHSGANIVASSDNLARFETVYDPVTFITAATALGIRVVADSKLLKRSSPGWTQFDFSSLPGGVDALTTMLGHETKTAPRLGVDCPLLRCVHYNNMHAC